MPTINESSLIEDNLTNDLHKLQEDEVIVNQQLDQILMRHCHVEAKLQSIRKVLPNVAVVKAETEKFRDMIHHTNILAEKVSAKVRQLDLARSRVCECQSRVNDILDLQLCCEGVATALENEDYEQGAAHVHRFLLMDQQLLEKTADDVSGIARIIEVHQPIIETYYGPGRLLTCAGILQKECDNQVKKIVFEFMKHRAISRKVQLINEHLRKQGVEKLEPKDLDILLSELTLMHARAELYNKFLRRRVFNDIEISTTDEQHRASLKNDFETIMKNSELARSMQELLGAYLALERYFMEESINKAIGMDALDQDQQTSSMIDDTFFIVKKCVKRSISSGSIDGVCAVINMACGLLENELSSQLKSRLRQGYPAGYLDLAQAYNALQTSFQHGRIQTSDTELARLMFLAYLNNAETSIEYVETLSRNLKIDIEQAFPNMQTKEKGKIESCLAGMKNVTFTLRTVVDYGLEQLRSSAIKPRINPWVDSFLTINHEADEEEILRHETDESFVQTLVMNLDGLLQVFKNSLMESNYNALIGILTTEVTIRLEKVIFKSSFNKIGGTILDNEIRALSNYFTSSTSWTVRDKFIRLQQIATILSVDKVEDVTEFCATDSISWRLSSAEVKKILLLRTDFRQEDIKRLKI
ncbi:conserved oligomeric Golgi complex subunit 4 isoform X2 [Trichogramma pretiosum]|uniref:conserved oligomeric Golgi complex subunit 4 isoform X2 n=1 Tax=Trichogramma pretiosum TaxID=7493 RepID=UPI000C719DD0|nr:conserved oligomeric Golgi complex subunit 4 isoform X2 [Trichogramma pretiosum]